MQLGCDKNCIELPQQKSPRACHVIFKRAHQVENSTKYRADEVCGNLVCDPHFFPQVTFFSDSFHYTKKQKNLYVGGFKYFSYTIQIGSNWYLDIGMRDLEVVVFKANFS